MGAEKFELSSLTLGPNGELRIIGELGWHIAMAEIFTKAVQLVESLFPEGRMWIPGKLHLVQSIDTGRSDGGAFALPKSFELMSLTLDPLGQGRISRPMAWDKTVTIFFFELN